MTHSTTRRVMASLAAATVLLLAAVPAQAAKGLYTNAVQPEDTPVNEYSKNGTPAYQYSQTLDDSETQCTLLNCASCDTEDSRKCSECKPGYTLDPESSTCTKTQSPNGKPAASPAPNATQSPKESPSAAGMAPRALAMAAGVVGVAAFVAML